MKRKCKILIRYLAQPPPEIAVAGGHDVAAVLPHALADAVVRVRSAVHARQPLDPRILRMFDFHVNYRLIPC